MRFLALEQVSMDLPWVQVLHLGIWWLLQLAFAAKCLRGREPWTFKREEVQAIL